MPRVAPIAEALAASRFGAPYLVGNAAGIIAERWPSDARAAPQGRSAASARYGLGGVARRRGRSSGGALRPFYLRAPDAKPSAIRCREPPAAPVMIGWFSQWWSGAPPSSSPRTLRDAARLAQLHGASFHRGWGEGEFEVMLSERNTLVHRFRLGRRVIGFAVSRMAADEAEILSIAVDTTIAAAGCRAVCCLPISAISPAVACAAFFSRSRKVTRRRDGSMNGPDSPSSDGASGITSSPVGNSGMRF